MTYSDALPWALVALALIPVLAIPTAVLTVAMVLRWVEVLRGIR